jgi:protoporphyrinogen oxidase
MIVIIGGGIAGLYAGYRLLTQYNFTDFVILETT